MVTEQTLKALSLSTMEDYFGYILESRANGQHTQSIELFRTLTEGMQGQRADFLNWLGDYVSPDQLEDTSAYYDRYTLTKELNQIQ